MYVAHLRSFLIVVLCAVPFLFACEWQWPAVLTCTPRGLPTVRTGLVVPFGGSSGPCLGLSLMTHLAYRRAWHPATLPYRWATIPLSLLVAVALLGIEAASVECERPFSSSPSKNPPYVESNVARTSVSWLSGGLDQRLIVLQAAPSFGQPRPISRLGRTTAGRPYRPLFLWT